MAKVIILSFSPSKDLFFFVCVVINYLILGFLFSFNSGFSTVKSKVKISLLCVFFFLSIFLDNFLI